MSLEINHLSLICDKMHHHSSIYDKLHDVSLESNYIKKSHRISFLARLPMMGFE